MFAVQLNEGDRDTAVSTHDNTTTEARIPQTQAIIIIFFWATISNSTWYYHCFLFKVRLAVAGFLEFKYHLEHCHKTRHTFIGLHKLLTVDIIPRR